MSPRAACTPASEKIRVGISRCLLGDKVRYDGGHQLDRYIVQTLGKYLEFVPVCPEVECGLPVPREAMRLMGDPAAPRLKTQKSGVDHTERMTAWAAKRAEELAAENLAGFIFKSRSPSSGMERIKVYPADGKGQASMTGVGLFAKAFMERHPLIPVEDDGRLHDSHLRENFLERLFAVKRWQDFLACGPGLGALVDYHTRHKLLIMSHSPKHYKLMGQIVAHAKGRDMSDVLAEYFRLLMEALTAHATVRRQCNVLQHVLGHFKKALTPDEKQECLDVVESYRAGDVPLIVPMTLLNHYVRKYADPYLAGQYYLRPHPLDLRLRAAL